MEKRDPFKAAYDGAKDFLVNPDKYFVVLNDGDMHLIPVKFQDFVNVVKDRLAETPNKEAREAILNDDQLPIGS